MEDEGFGCYNTYFNILKFLGSFPYRAQNYGVKLSVASEGIFLWFYYLNFIFISFATTFQICKLLLGLHFVEGTKPDLLGEATWALLLLIPLWNYFYLLRQEEHVVTAVQSWCNLERRIIGSAFRGLPSAKQGPTPILSSCHSAQRHHFAWVTWAYLFMLVVSLIGVGMHCNTQPRFPGYLYSITSEDNPILMHLSMVWQLWLVVIIWSHIYAVEGFVIISSSSIGHILENVSYRAGVVMVRWVCDEFDVDDLISESINTFQSADKSKMKSASTAIDFRRSSIENSNKILVRTQNPFVSELGILKGPGESENPKENFHHKDIAHVIQNLVDIEFALDTYYHVQNTVNDMNHTFGLMLAHHQMAYLLMLTLMGFSVIKFFSDMHLIPVIFLVIQSFFYLFRMFIFFPAMGNLDHRSDAFIDSWMEGLRYIPKGKYSYEFYWYKIQSCRLLHFWCGRYYTMERATCLEFLYRISEFVIVLLQIY